jgi:formate dehydrogenase maturation protein FdhE
MLVTLCPSRPRARGSEPTTSARPPVDANGCASDATNTNHSGGLSGAGDASRRVSAAWLVTGRREGARCGPPWGESVAISEATAAGRQNFKCSRAGAGRPLVELRTSWSTICSVAEAQQSRSEPREIAELRRLKEAQPDLAAAADLQIELLQLQRRVQQRVPLPHINLESHSLAHLLARGPVLRFDDLAIDWSDLRFLLRAVAAAMRTHDALERDELQKLDRITRDAERLPRLVRSWYDLGEGGTDDLAGLENVVLQAMRPVLTRAADAVLARLDTSAWQRGICPVCGGEPDLAVITPAAERFLICGRCLARWPFAQLVCPFCLNDDRSRITSFASRDGQYRLHACDVCERYVKAYDARRATRPVMPPVDSVATLPLDAAAIQRGYK